MPPATGKSSLDNALKRLPELYLFCSLFAALLLCIITPPFYVPDEHHHAYRAIQIAHGEVVPKVVRKDALGETDANLYATSEAFIPMQQAHSPGYRAIFHSYPPEVDFAQLAELQKSRWAGRQVTAIYRNTMVYPPPFYLLQAAGLRFGELHGWTIIHSAMLGRLLSAFVACILGWLALRVAPAGRPLIFALLLLPSVLNVQASLSQDSLGFPVAALAVAILSRSLMERRNATTLEFLSAGLCLLLSIASRTPYLPLLVLLFLPALNSPRLQWRQLLTPAAICLAVVCAIAIWQALVHPVGTFTDDLADPPAQIAFLKTHPLLGLAYILIGTVRSLSKLALLSPAMMARFDTPGTLSVYLVLYAGIGLLLTAISMPLLVRPRGRLAVFLALTAIVFGISLAEYIIWNPVAAHTILGLQARYYFPLLPAAFLLLPSQPILKTVHTKRLLIVGIAIFALVAIYTPFMAAHRYYSMSLLHSLRLAIA